MVVLTVIEAYSLFLPYHILHFFINELHFIITAKPIDLLAKYISAEEEVDAVEMHEPYTYLNGLQIKDLEDLVEDIKVYQELERGKNLDYWNDITVIVEDELHKLRKLEKQNSYDIALNRREGIHQAVAKDVTEVFKGKLPFSSLNFRHRLRLKLMGKQMGLILGIGNPCYHS